MKKKKKEWNSDTWHNTDEPWKHYSRWNETDAEGHVSYDPSYAVPRICKFLETESRIKVTKGW